MSHPAMRREEKDELGLVVPQTAIPHLGRLRTAGDDTHRPWRPLPDAGTDGDASEIPRLTNVMPV